MRHAIVIGVLLLLSAVCFAQENITVQQCRSDFQNWQSDGSNGLNARALSAQIINFRLSQLSSCAIIDDPMEVHYLAQSVSYSSDLLLRYLMFIKRHNLGSEFIKEDENPENRPPMGSQR